MYIPHKQDSIKQELDLILTKAYKNFIDKKDIMELLNCSEKTAERRMNKLGLTHTKNELISLLKDYEKGLKTKELALKYDCSDVNVNSVARRHGLSRPIGFFNTIKADYYYFDDIDTEEKSYILGFIAADGHVGDNSIILGLSSVDIEILEKIKNCLNSDAKIIISEQLCTLNNKISEICQLSFHSIHMVKTLRNLGFTRTKTKDFTFPDIPKEFYLHFLRGYFDGDGSMTKCLSNDGYTRYSLSIEGTESFLNFVKEFIESNYSIKFNTKLYKRFNTENCCYSLKSSGKINVCTFLDLLYKDSSIYLDRKYKKYLSFKE